MAQTPEARNTSNMYVLIAVAAVQLFGALQAVLVTANEYGPAGSVWLYIGLDVLLTVVPAILLVQVSRDAPPSGLKSFALLGGVVAILAGLVKLGARLSGDAGWYTGHYSYSLGG